MAAFDMQPRYTSYILNGHNGPIIPITYLQSPICQITVQSPLETRSRVAIRMIKFWVTDKNWPEAAQRVNETFDRSGSNRGLFHLVQAACCRFFIFLSMSFSNREGEIRYTRYDNHAIRPTGMNDRFLSYPRNMISTAFCGDM